MSNLPASLGYTLEFVRASLPAGARSILEIGCGDGALAELLAAEGFALVGIDADGDCVAAAKARGVDARRAEWPAEVEDTFDAILFTRSLHHIHDLQGGIDAARDALRPDGRLIVEDFRAEGGSARSSGWYEAMVWELAGGGALAEDATIEALLAKQPPAAHGGHELHSSTVIREALDRWFDVTASDAAYYFRYLEPHLREEGAAKWLLDVELEHIEAGEIDALGKRFVTRAA